MKLYIDADFKCHTTNPDGSFREVTLSDDTRTFFSDKCTAFVEGFRLKPEGETWVREDGKAFSDGEMIAPWKDYTELDEAQREYERGKLADAEAALAILLGGAI